MKHIYKSLLLSLLLVAGAFGNYIRAERLTPEEALRRVESSSPRRVAGVQPSSRLSLAFTQCERTTDLAMVYVFNHADGKEGFLVLAADDVVGDIMLGYSDDSTFDPNDIPTSMQWLLSAYSDYVARAAERSRTSLGLAEDTGLQSLNLSKAPQKAARQSISPLVKTQWNQGSPYNNNCPTVGGQRCVTGCVATAMAQVMKYHEWPTTGTGSYTHTFTCNNRSYTTSADFGSTTYNWANMTNTYGTYSSSNQKNAVATLMHHCGVASQMGYSPDASGTSDIVAAQGLITYFKYDKSLRYLSRSWFDTDEWSDLIYEHLAQSRPIMYAGRTDSNEGHEFVCDGYDAGSAFFHINWGWGGVADGYYMLSSLEPTSQGIGGSTDGAGFSYGQSILYGIKPDAGGNMAISIGQDEALTTDKTEYTRNSSTAVTIGGGFYSYALGTTNVTLGLQFTDESSTRNVSVGSIDLQTFYGLSSFQVAATSFPVGEWDMRVAYKDETGAWKPVYYDHTLTDGFLHVVVTAGKVTFSETETGDATIEGTLQDIVPTNEADGDNFYIGHSYNFRYSLTTNSSWSGTMYCAVFDNDGNIVALSDGQSVTVNRDSEVQEDFLVTLSADKVAAGTYNFALGYADGNTLRLCSEVMQISVTEYSSEVEPVLVAELSNCTPSNGQDKDIYLGNEYDFTFDLTSETGWSGTLVCVITNQDGYILSRGYADQPTTLDVEESSQATFRVRMPADQPAGKYILYLCDISDGVYDPVFYVYSTLSTIPHGDDVNYVTAYHLSTPRGYLPERTAGTVTLSTELSTSGTYLLIQLPDTDEYYLYCTNNKSFIKSSDFDNTDGFLAQPDGTFTITQIEGSQASIIAAKSSGHYLQFGGSRQLLVNNWNVLDDGNQWMLSEAGQYDATEVYDALHLYDTLVGDVNGDGAVDQLDIAALVGYLIGEQGESFIAESADLNEDGSIDVLDITLLIDIVDND